MASQVDLPPSPKIFLVDGYALIYRAFFAMISRPLTTSRGENTSAAWGIVNFLQRLVTTHKPDYLGWVHDSGLSFRHERYPAYKATREKLSGELQDDFNRGMERIGAILEAWRVPVITLKGYEADDVIGTLARKGVEAGMNVVVVSGDKDFQQLVRPGVWLLNPGRGGPASVEENWVSTENGSERLGVAPALVTDFLALVGDSSDNVPGVKGIGDKGAQELVNSYGSLENILAHVDEISKKRPREALQAQREEALLSKELVTIRDDLEVDLNLEAMRMTSPDLARLRTMYVELEFHTLARNIEVPEGTSTQPAEGGDAPVAVGAPPPAPPTHYATANTIDAMERAVERAYEAPYIAVDLETVTDPTAPYETDPLRCAVVGVTIAVAPGEAYYLPIAHRERKEAPGELGLELGLDAPATPAAPAKKARAKKTADPASIAGKALAAGTAVVENLPPLDDPAM